jgi:hypothetical protein
MSVKIDDAEFKRTPFAREWRTRNAWLYEGGSRPKRTRR